MREKKERSTQIVPITFLIPTARGITSLKYGDEPREKEIGEKAIERNYEFKKRQVVGYNLQNENRKHMNLGYLPPSSIIKKYAIELGVKLLEPFSVRDEEREAIARTSIENEKLKIQIEEMQKQHMAEMTEFKQMMQKLLEKDEEPKRKGNPNWVKKTE